MNRRATLHRPVSGLTKSSPDCDRAIEDYSQAIQIDGKSAALWNGRCWVRAIIGQLQQALSDCNQSLDLQPNDANARDSRAFLPKNGQSRRRHR
jgi:tetratricopeptide (TPR) repeat protein